MTSEDRSETHSVGSYRPEVVNSPEFTRFQPERLEELSTLPGLSAEATDFLESRNYRLALPASTMTRVSGGRPVAGHAVTLRYLPRRRHERFYRGRGDPSRLSFRFAFQTAQPGDVVVMDAGGILDRSVLGGNAAAVATDRGVAACIVDGAVRDLDEIEALGFPLWSRALTPMGATFDLEAVELNGPIVCAGVQVRPGDLVVADISGVAFVPSAEIEEFLRVTLR